ncbi:MAG: Nif3-like dinuclear metal center hexameric protein [Flavobacteriales bacterium]|nr:Nif3-like dinuclear metal center hexameric protein [Flavobacteriales bacterium]
MKIKEVLQFLEGIAPRSLQESYDNAGLIVGNDKLEVSSALICLDSTEEVVDEAIRKGCNLIIAHHPIVFSGLKQITGRTYIERVVLKAIKHDIAIYAIHTNLDNVLGGVNAMISDKLGLVNRRILSPKSGLLQKLVVYVPVKSSESLRDSLFQAGAGEIGNYSECSFNIDGEGTFKGNEHSNPVIGSKGQRHTEPEIRVEVLVESWTLGNVIAAMHDAHPYEEVAYDVLPVSNIHSTVGAGMVGDLPESQDLDLFLEKVSKVFKAQGIRYTDPVSKKVSKVALCGGSGSFLLEDAKAAGADVFITGDFKYHQFFDADGKLTILDIGHYESEQFTIELLGGYLREKFPNFALHFTDINTNPVNYYKG